jgi:hypothetical protein
MEERRIGWDENKNVENKLKHKIGFETARYVFADPERLWRLDRSAGNPPAWPKVWFLWCIRIGKWKA